ELLDRVDRGVVVALVVRADRITEGGEVVDEFDAVRPGRDTLLQLPVQRCLAVEQRHRARVDLVQRLAALNHASRFGQPGQRARLLPGQRARGAVRDGAGERGLVDQIGAFDRDGFRRGGPGRAVVGVRRAEPADGEGGRGPDNQQGDQAREQPAFHFSPATSFSHSGPSSRPLRMDSGSLCSPPSAYVRCSSPGSGGVSSTYLTPLLRRHCTRSWTKSADSGLLTSYSHGGS